MANKLSIALVCMFAVASTSLANTVGGLAEPIFDNQNGIRQVQGGFSLDGNVLILRNHEIEEFSGSGSGESPTTSNLPTTPSQPQTSAVPRTTKQPAQLTVLDVSSALSISGIEDQIQTQFQPLFIAFCNSSASNLAQCLPYLSSAYKRDSSSMFTDCYDVIVPRSSESSDNSKTLYLAVGFLCGEASFLPSSLLVSFFSDNKTSFDSISITNVYSISLVTNSSATSPTTTSPTVVYVDNNAYMIATICLAVVTGLLLIGLVSYFIYEKKCKKQNQVTAFPDPIVKATTIV